VTVPNVVAGVVLVFTNVTEPALTGAVLGDTVVTVADNVTDWLAALIAGVAVKGLMVVLAVATR
jgi:fructose-specific phosphotransferase system IIC component